MTLFEFNKAEALVARRIPFRSLIMAAMQVGDRDALSSLKGEWPDVFKEVQIRLNDERNYDLKGKGQMRLGER